MNIVYTVDDNFVPQVATSMCSIMENNKKLEILFYIISKGISDSNKEKLFDFVDSYNQKVVIIELGDLNDYIDFEFDTSGWNEIVLARLILDKLLPETVEKILYLDGDIIVRDSLEELWNIDLGANVIGGVIEPTADIERKQAIGLSPQTPYINAGVLLINMNKWRDFDAGKKVLDFYRAHDGKLFSNDQCAINGALKNHILQLPIVYNFCNTYRFYSYEALCKIAYPTKLISKEEFNKCLSNPVIIHFLGEERPWRIGNKHTYRDEYINYWNKTPWKNSSLEYGWKRYFLFFNLFNTLMKPFPILRYKIINRLIPVFLQYRSRKKKVQSNRVS